MPMRVKFSGDISCGNCKYFLYIKYQRVYCVPMKLINRKLHYLHKLIECNLKTKHFDSHQKEHLNIFEEQAAVVNNG